MRDTRQRMKYLDDLPGLIEDYLRDLPQLFALPVLKHDQDKADNGPRIYKVTPDTTPPRPAVDQEATGRKYRGIYERLGLKVVKHADELEITWDFGQGFSEKCALRRCRAVATIFSSSTLAK